MSDGILSTRRAVLTVLKAAPDVTAFVPAARIYPQATPSLPGWPFIRCGSPTAVPLTAACVDGAEVSFAVHAFAKAREAGGQLVESAEDHAARIGAAIKATLAGTRYPIDGGYIAIRWTGCQLLQDGDEADAFHSIQQFRARVIV